MVSEASAVPSREARPERRLLPASAILSTRPLPPPIPAAGPLPKRRPIVSIACECCRRAKAKCSGDRPVCRRCQKHRQHCMYAARAGETPAQALKRTYSTLQDQAALQEKIFELLAVLPEDEAQHVLRRIRSGVPAEVICNQIMAGDALMQLAVAPESHFRYNLLYQPQMPEYFVHNNPYLDTLIYQGESLYASGSPSSTLPSSATRDPVTARRGECHESAYLMPFHAAAVVEPLLTDVKPSLWTEVCKDDMLMRDLLRVWLHCEYTFTCAFQKDYFLEDMASQSEDFCSSLLVNAVLAYCCTCYPSMSSRAEYWNPQTLAYGFLAEARRLWELEATKPSLPTLQAGLIFNVFYNSCGLDEIGQAFRINSFAMAHKVGLYKEPIEGKTQRIRDGMLFAAWTMYNWEALIALAFQQPPLITKPPSEPLPDPATHSRWYGEIWARYPTDQHLSPLHFSYLFKAKTGLRMIMQRFCATAYTKGRNISLEEAYKLYAQLKRWEEDLPSALQARRIVLPAHLQLHLYLHYVTLAIFEPLVDEKLSPGLIHNPDPREIVAEATRNLQTLIRVYYLRHGFEATDFFIVIPIVYAGFKCLDAINDKTPESNLDLPRSTLMLVVKALYHQRKNLYVAELLYQVIRGRMRPQELTLAKDILALPEVNEDDNFMRQAVRSHWPVSVVKRREDLDSLMLANLVGELSTTRDIAE